MAVFIVSLLVALGVSGLCSVAEAVLLSLSTAQIVEIGKKNRQIGEIWTFFKKDVDSPITSILAVNTAAHTIGASVAGAYFQKLFGANWVWLFSVVFTFMMLQYTEILPKTLGVRFNKKIAFWIARPLWLATKVGAPVIRAIRLLNRPFEPRGKNQEVLSAVQEITLLTSLARSRRQLDAEQEKIILATLKLAEKTAGDAMVPFDEVSTLSDQMSMADALSVAHSDAHTRFPVTRGADRDDVVGYVNFKEIVGRQRLAPTATDFKDVVRPIMRIAPTAKASDVLNSLVKNHEHIALVVDPKTKRNLGVLTLEDVVEELVGEIEDEFDRLPETLHELQGNVFVAGGGATLAKVGATAARLFPNESAQFLSEIADKSGATRLTRWLETKIGGPIGRNRRIECGGLTFFVRRARRGQVFDAQILPSVAAFASKTASSGGVDCDASENVDSIGKNVGTSGKIDATGKNEFLENSSKTRE